MKLSSLPDYSHILRRSSMSRATKTARSLFLSFLSQLGSIVMLINKATFELGNKDPAIDRTHVLRLPNAGAQLHLPIGTVTSKIKRPLVTASRGPALLRHLQKYNNWDPSVTHTVDWATHGLVCRNVSHPVTHTQVFAQYFTCRCPTPNVSLQV